MKLVILTGAGMSAESGMQNFPGAATVYGKITGSKMFVPLKH